MTTFIMGTRLAPEVAPAPGHLDSFEQQVMERIRRSCPEVRWLHSWAVLGPFDYVDVFEAADIETAMRVSAIFRSFGRAHSEIWPAMEWAHFKELIHTLPPS